MVNLAHLPTCSSFQSCQSGLLFIAITAFSCKKMTLLEKNWKDTVYVDLYQGDQALCQWLYEYMDHKNGSLKKTLTLGVEQTDIKMILE